MGPTWPFSWSIERLGVLMHPRRGVREEREGVLNPGGVRGPDGAYYLFPRHVACGNYSRIGLARVHEARDGDPLHAQRLGYVFAPGADYDAGGCEDARVSYLAARQSYLMVYTGLGDEGPRLCLAQSADLGHWRRLGPVRFRRAGHLDLSSIHNKDGALFPEPVRAPNGRLSWCLMHRPITGSCGLSIWLSYLDTAHLGRPGACWGQHTVLAAPTYHWEKDRIGGGTVPLLTPEGWLVFYHGVSHGPVAGTDPQLRARVYSCGAMVLGRSDPRQVLARTAEPLFGPKTLSERCGQVPNVVFPTAVDVQRAGMVLYYGAADYAICALRLA